MSTNVLPSSGPLSARRSAAVSSNRRPALAQAGDQLQHRVVGELLAQRLGQHRADPLDLGDRLGVGGDQRVDRAEVLRDRGRR